MATIILTTGVPGSGKTYVRAARFLVDDFLVNSRGIHISNFPLNIENISVEVANKINKNRGFFGIFRKPVIPDDIKNRLELIPSDVQQLWRAGISGPWEYFSGRDLRYSHIAIDEIHNFIHDRQDPECLKKWDDFLGEVRHRGCTFEGLTQDHTQVHQILVGRASVRLELVPGEDMRDPFFKIPMSDWYELKAGFTGFYHKTVFVLEKRKQNSRWKTNHVYRFLISPDYFKFYNSFNASLQETEGGKKVDDDRAPLHEYQQRNRFSLLLWFVRRNFLSIFIRTIIVIVVCWLLLFGGLSFLINLFVSSLVHKDSNSVSKSHDVKEFVADPSNNSPTSDISFNNSLSSVPDPSTISREKLEAIRYLEAKEKAFFDMFRPCLFIDGDCYLRNGIKIDVGFVFSDKKMGSFYGKKVVSVNSSDRYYLLDDSTRVSSDGM